jgi:uncharacterized membrane protein
MNSTFFGHMTWPRALLSGFMLTIGVLHFTHAPTFASIIPDYLPAPLTLVYVSGVFEILLGGALLFEPTRPLAAWGLCALYIAVFPANVHMALHPDLPIAGITEASRLPPLALWLRLPLQLGFVLWAYRYTRPGSRRLAQTA